MQSIFLYLGLLKDVLFHVEVQPHYFSDNASTYVFHEMLKLNSEEQQLMKQNMTGRKS